MQHSSFGFHPDPGGPLGPTRTTAPEPGGPEAMPEREWGLSAGQVAAAVLVIIAFCELVGLMT